MKITKVFLASAIVMASTPLAFADECVDLNGIWKGVCTTVDLDAQGRLERGPDLNEENVEFKQTDCKRLEMHDESEDVPFIFEPGKVLESPQAIGPIVVTTKRQAAWTDFGVDMEIDISATMSLPEGGEETFESITEMEISLVLEEDGRLVLDATSHSDDGEEVGDSKIKCIYKK